MTIFSIILKLNRFVYSLFTLCIMLFANLYNVIEVCFTLFGLHLQTFMFIMGRERFRIHIPIRKDVLI